MRAAIRAAGFISLAVIAIALYVVLAPAVGVDTVPVASQYESLVAAAVSDYELNNFSADSAPKQQVVNGWLAKDLLTIIAKEQADLIRAQGGLVDALGTLKTYPFDERIPALLVVGVIALAWNGLTAPRSTFVVNSQTPGLGALSA